jgi:signal transduction histidine kinase
MRKAGIHVRLLLAGFLLISATTLTMGYMGVKIIHQFVQARFEERIRFLAKYLALNAELGILIDERTMLKQLARNLLSERDVARVGIYNSKEEVLADESHPAIHGTNAIEVPVVLKESMEESLAFQWNSTRDPEDQLIGFVRITYTTEGIQVLLTMMKVRFVWLAIILAVFSVLIFFFISRSLVAPVTYLARSARQVARGDLTLRVKPSRLPETRELGEAFNAMLDSLEKSEKALMEVNKKMVRQKTLAEMGKFSMMIAHEVKNPLSIIKSSVDILKKDLIQPETNTMITYIEDEINRLNRLIEDFLTFARPAQPAFRQVDINAMLEECVIRLEQSVNPPDSGDVPVKINMRLPAHPVHLQADPDLLIRAIGNILKNAFDATGNQGEIGVFVSYDNYSWILKISDNGSGIDAENTNRIFEPFFTTRAKGTGLGLAFVSQVVQAHGGRISAANHRNGGAVFRMELPLRKESNNIHIMGEKTLHSDEVEQ